MARSIGSTPSSTGRILVQWLSRIVGDLFRNAKYRREIKTLADLDDRLLKDIGLTRGDVEGALSEPLLGNPSVVLLRSVERHSRSERVAPRTRRPNRPVVPVVSRPAKACS